MCILVFLYLYIVTEIDNEWFCHRLYSSVMKDRWNKISFFICYMSIIVTVKYTSIYIDIKHMRLWQYVFFTNQLTTFVSRHYRISWYEFILDFMIRVVINHLSWNAHEILLDIVQKQARLFKYENINVPAESILYCIWLNEYLD